MSTKHVVRHGARVIKRSLDENSEACGLSEPAGFSYVCWRSWTGSVLPSIPQSLTKIRRSRKYLTAWAYPLAPVPDRIHQQGRHRSRYKIARKTRNPRMPSSLSGLSNPSSRGDSYFCLEVNNSLLTDDFHVAASERMIIVVQKCDHRYQVDLS